ncbi:MAG: 3-hydroxyisobutyrate dehydrogenase [Pseudomonadota bacterium]
MTTVAFIGLGNMGGPMAANLVSDGLAVLAYDLNEAALARAVEGGAWQADSVAQAVSRADAVITMLPAGRHVEEVYTAPDGVIANAQNGTLFIDSSTIDVEAARRVAAAAQGQGFDMVDAPVSGGVAAASAGTLTFMVGGTPAAFARAKPYLATMGKAIIHAGDSGAGQAAKICNNMMLGIQMVSVCEAFVLAEKLGLEADKLFEISAKASGQCWSLTSYCPVPGPVPAAPSNRDYKPGFAAAMMLKDLKLAQEAASAAGVATPLGALAAALYQEFADKGGAAMDFSGIIKMLRDR